MSETLTVKTTLEPRGPAAAIVLDDDQLEALGGGRKAFPVLVTIGGTTVPLRVARMRGETLVGFSKATRAEFGVEPGDEVEATIVVDPDR